MEHQHTKSNFTGMAIRVLALLISMLAIYTAFLGTTAPGIPHEINHRAWNLVLALALTYLMYPLRAGSKRPTNRILSVIDFLLLATAIVSVGYLALFFFQTSLREGAWYRYEYWLGFLALLTCLEACRRLSGLSIPVLCIISILYALYGHLMPGYLGHAPYSLSRVISYLYLGWDGLFGVAMGAFTTYILPFVVFGAFLKHSGAGDIFTDLALAAFGRQRGGPGKGAILASALFGTISGSSVANVVGTGSFTIPLMTKYGFAPDYAAALAAVAGTGGQIMPPVMGACAFLMAEMLETTYARVCLTAAIPAILYYFSLFFLVDVRAVKQGLTGIPADRIPRVGAVMKRGWHLLVPLPVLVYLIFRQFSPMLSSIVTCILIVLFSHVRKETGMGISKIVNALEDAAKSAVPVCVDCACLGIVSGLILMTGLGSQMASALIGLSRGNIGILLLLTMITSLIMGMGLPVVACYVILAVMVVPALTKMGLQPILAHMFILYYGAFAHITPPVAEAAMVGASIAGTDYMKTGWLSCKLGIVGFLMPFCFVYDPAVAAIGSPAAMALGFVRCAIAACLLCILLEGFYFAATSMPERLLLGVAVCLLLKPDPITTAAGLAIGAAVLLRNYRVARTRMVVGS